MLPFAKSSDDFMSELKQKIKTRPISKCRVPPFATAPSSVKSKNIFSVFSPVLEPTADFESPSPEYHQTEAQSETPETQSSKVAVPNCSELQDDDTTCLSNDLQEFSEVIYNKRQELCDSLFTLCHQSKTRTDTVRCRRVVECKVLTAHQRKLGKFYARLAQKLISMELESVQLSYISSFFFEQPPPPPTVVELQKFQKRMAAGNFSIEDRFFEVSAELTEKYPGVLPEPSAYSLLSVLE